MRKLYLILLFLPIFGFGSCVKQKNCDCELPVTGKFVYYENQREIMYCGNIIKVNAGIRRSDYDSSDESEYAYFNIIGSIPKIFQMKDTVYVTACLKEVQKKGCLTFGVGTIYKLTCIEKEDKL